jgi:cation transporter-like permease
MLDAEEKLKANKRAANRMRLIAISAYIGAMVIVVGFVAVAEIALGKPSDMPTSAIIAFDIGLSVLLIAMLWSVFRRAILAGNVKTLEEAQAIAKSLQETHPEILETRRLDDLLNKASAGRTFWRGLGVNMLFTVVGTVLGIILTVAAQGLGWLPR